MLLADIPPAPGTKCTYGTVDGHRVTLTCTSSGLSTWEITLIIAGAIALALIVATMLVLLRRRRRAKSA